MFQILQYIRAKYIGLLFLIFTLIALTSSYSLLFAANSAVITVQNTNDSGAGSLRQALADAAPNDTIQFAAAVAGQTITLQSLLAVTESVTIEGDAAAPVKISGNGSVQGFDLADDTSVVMRNLIVADMFESTCAGITSRGALLLDNVTVEDNRARFYGAGVCAYGASLNIENSRLHNNEVIEASRGSSNGGAVFASVTSLIVRDSIFENNASLVSGSDIYQVHSSTASDPSIATFEVYGSTFGGELFNSVFNFNPASQLTIENTTFDGGGVFNAGVMTAENVVIKNGMGFRNVSFGVANLNNMMLVNNAQRWGGGIANSGVLTVQNSAIISNTTGGIANSGTISLTNVTLSGNIASADADASALALDDRPFSAPLSAYLNHVTIAGNGGDAGAVISAETDQTITMRNTLIANNSNAVNCSSLTIGISLGHSISDDDSCELPNSSDTINATSIGLQPLQDNGGDTLTHGLDADSIAIDAGDVATCPDTDQRGSGYSRLVDGDDDGVVICDVGAFEYLAGPAELEKRVYLPFIQK